MTEKRDSETMENKPEANLEGFLDSDESLEFLIETAHPEMKKEKIIPAPPAHVSLIEDPFGLKNLEISDAQDIADELDLDRDLQDFLPEDPAQLEQLAQAVAEADAKAVQEEQELIASDAIDSAAELAKQIAEDEALAQKLAEELAGEDEELAAALPKADAEGNLDIAEMESCIEALLFMADKPMSLNKLREMLGPDFENSVFEQALSSLTQRFAEPNHGIELVQVAGGYQFRTKPGRALLARKLAKVQTQRLSSGGMETLAIVAYRQPVLKDEIDKIRGVDSSYFIRGLMEKKLIKISGRSELPGKPMLYSTTDEFLALFGLNDLSALPPLHEIEKMIPASQTANPEDEDPRVKEMRRLVGEMKSDTSTSLVYDPREDEKILQEIRERVGSIPTSTPYLEEQKALEKQAKEAAEIAAAQQPQPELPSLGN